MHPEFQEKLKEAISKVIADCGSRY